MSSTKSAALLAGVLLLGWGLSGPAGAEPPVAGRTSSRGEVAPQPQEPSEQKITLLSAGDEADRRLLRFSPTEGTVQIAKLWSKSEAEARFNDHPIAPMRLPGVWRTLEVTVQEPGTDGEIHYTARVTRVTADVSSDSSFGKEFQQQLTPLTGTLIEVVLNDRGARRSITWDASSEASPTVTALIEDVVHGLRHVSVPLPGEPVGLGATWRAVDAQPMRGIVAPITTEYTLKDWTATGVKLTCRLALTAEPQEISNRLISEGTKVHLESLAGTGEGEFELDLSLPIPLLSTLDVVMDTVTDVGVGSKTDRMTQTTKSNLRLTSEQVKPASK